MASVEEENNILQIWQMVRRRMNYLMFEGF